MINDRPQRTTTGRTQHRLGLGEALAELSRRLVRPSRLTPIRVATARPSRRVRPVRSWDRLTHA